MPFDDEYGMKQCTSVDWAEYGDVRGNPKNEWKPNRCIRYEGHDGWHMDKFGNKWVTPKQPPRPNKKAVQMMLRDLIGR